MSLLRLGKYFVGLFWLGYGSAGRPPVLSLF